MKNGLPFPILVVDDDEDDRLVIDEAFMDLGLGGEVRKFINGQAMFHYLDSVDPELYPRLIVLDNTLPSMGSNAIIKRLREEPHFRKIRIVIYTTSVSAAKEAELREAGAYRCIQKGSTMDEVHRDVMELVAIAGLNIKAE